MTHKINYQTDPDEYFNPKHWQRKQLFLGLTRYFINIVLFLLGAAIIKWGAGYVQLNPGLLKASAGACFLLGICIRISFEWERVPVLRLGKYLRTSGPGVFFIIPIFDSIIGYVDCRIKVTDFSAEKVLTNDAVPVYIDAIIFWMVWDAAKTCLEVEYYARAVALSAKTALRETIGKNTLTRLLTDRDGVGQEIQKVLDSKTNPWGITSLSVEIKDIILPEELEDAMSKEAQAEREKNARLILSRAENEIADNLAEASKKYSGNPEALQLRSLNILMEALKKNGSMILVPSDIPSLMNIASAAGITKNIIHKADPKEK